MRQRFPHQAQGANIQRLVFAAPRRGDRILQPAAGGEAFHQFARQGVEALFVVRFLVRQGGDFAIRPDAEIAREFAVRFVKKRPVKISLLGQGSVSLEDGFLLCDEGVVGALEILGLHADGLSLGFRRDGVLDAHVPFHV